jgi:hypothetical protein
MTIPVSVYQGGKVAEDLKSCKNNIDSSAIIRRSLEKRKKTGKGLFGQILEYLRLRRSPGGLDLKDYYVYHLYDDSRYSFAEKQRFVSDRFYFKIVEKCCDKRWWILADDKYWADTVLRAHGFPVPETQAVFCEGDREFGSVHTLHDNDELEKFFGREAQYPVYSKPVNGIASLGNFLIEGMQDASLRFHDGSQMPVSDFAAQIDRSIGQLFQSTLLSHPDLTDVCGRVSTVRVILIIQNGEVKIVNTVWKVPDSRNMADNFWRDGNCLGAIDSATGAVERVVGYVDRIPKELSKETAMGSAMLGRKLPRWQEVIDLCVTGARIFAPLRFQSWDIALTESGPVVVEVNPGSSFVLSQIASGNGFLTDEFLEFLLETGCKTKRFAK